MSLQQTKLDYNVDDYDESSKDFAVDATALLFLLLGKFGIIRQIMNQSEFGKRLEPLTRFKCNKLYPHLRHNSQDEFHKRPKARQKLDRLIEALEGIVEYLKNERFKAS